MGNFMQQQILEKQLGWEVETGDGTYFVPECVHAVPGWLKHSVYVEREHVGVFDQLAAELGDYVLVQEERFSTIRAVHGWFGRLSAPGYMDCTEWCFSKTLKGLREQLREYE